MHACMLGSATSPKRYQKTTWDLTRIIDGKTWATAVVVVVVVVGVVFVVTVVGPLP